MRRSGVFVAGNKGEREGVQGQERVGLAQLLAERVVHLFGQGELAGSQNLRRTSCQQRTDCFPFSR